jgi:hypothetical protein
LPLQSSLMSKTYLKSDHFVGGGSPIMALSIAHKEAPEPPDRGRAQLAIGRHEVDAFLIGTPLGLGILLALGIVMVAMSHLSQ